MSLVTGANRAEPAANCRVFAARPAGHPRAIRREQAAWLQCARLSRIGPRRARRAPFRRRERQRDRDRDDGGDGRSSARAVLLCGRGTWPAIYQAQPENCSGRARRLRARRTEPAIRRRSAVSARLQARSIRRNRHRNNVARALGRRCHGRTRGSCGQRMRAAGHRGPEGRNRDSRRAVLMRRRKDLRRFRQAAGRRRA